MRSRYGIWSVLFFGCLALAAGAYAGAERSGWSTYRGDALEYYASRLPNPIVMYVYSTHGNLVGLINPNGHSDAKSLQKVEQAIAGQKFTKVTASQGKFLDTSLRNFLRDQGYRMSDITSQASKYVIVLAMQEVRKSDCQAYVDVENRFKDVIRKAIATHATTKPIYSVVVLEVGSPKARITCNKK